MNEINAQYRIICWYLRASFHRKQLLNLLLLFLIKLVPLLNFRIAEPTFRRWWVWLQFVIRHALIIGCRLEFVVDMSFQQMLIVKQQLLIVTFQLSDSHRVVFTIIREWDSILRVAYRNIAWYCIEQRTWRCCHCCFN